MFYGTLPLFTARFVADIVVEQTGDPTWRSYDGIHRVWRAVNAVADSLVIFFVFLIGMRLHNKWTGLVAAILYAASVLPIQLSHFGTTDVITGLFVVIALYFAVRTQDTSNLLDYVSFGLGLGAAVASRVNVAPLAGVIVVVATIHVIPMFDSRLAWSERNRLFHSSFRRSNFGCGCIIRCISTHKIHMRLVDRVSLAFCLMTGLLMR